MEEQKAEQKAVIMGTIIMSVILGFLIMIVSFFNIKIHTSEVITYPFGILIFAIYYSMVQKLKKSYVEK